MATQQATVNGRSSSQPPRRRYDDDNGADDHYVRDVDYDQIDRIRTKELAVIRPDRPSASRDRDRDRDYDYAPRRYRGDNPDYAGGRQVAAYGGGGNREVYDNRRSRRRDEESDDDSSSDSDDSRRRRRRRRERQHRHGGKSRNRSADGDNKNDDDNGRLWYSGKQRSDASFFEKNFDTSYDGLGAAIAGGLIGGITARRFAGDEKRKEKMAGAALLGAVTFNAAENWYRVYTEEKIEKKESKWENKFGEGSHTGKNKGNDY